MTESFALEVGGQRLVTAPFEELGVEQDGWITAKLERAGLADPSLATLSGAARAEEVRLRVLESGEIGPLLAGFLVAEGQPWSADAARRHTALLRSSDRSVVDRALLYAMVEGLVQGFFAHGLTGASATSGPLNKDEPEESSSPS